MAHWWNATGLDNKRHPLITKTSEFGFLNDSPWGSPKSQLRSFGGGRAHGRERETKRRFNGQSACKPNAPICRPLQKLVFYGRLVPSRHPERFSRRRDIVMFCVVGVKVKLLRRSAPLETAGSDGFKARVAEGLNSNSARKKSSSRSNCKSGFSQRATEGLTFPWVNLP